MLTTLFLKSPADVNTYHYLNCRSQAIQNGCGQEPSRVRLLGSTPDTVKTCKEAQ